MGQLSLCWRLSPQLQGPISDSTKSCSSPSQREAHCRVLSLGDSVRPAWGGGSGEEEQVSPQATYLLSFFFGPSVTKPKAIGVCLLTAPATCNPCSSQSRGWIPTCPTCSPECIALTSLLGIAEEGSMPALAGWHTLTTACCCHTTLLAA